jgi:hypothetical protein
MTAATNQDDRNAKRRASGVYRTQAERDRNARRVRVAGIFVGRARTPEEAAIIRANSRMIGTFMRSHDLLS